MMVRSSFQVDRSVPSIIDRGPLFDDQIIYSFIPVADSLGPRLSGTFPFHSQLSYNIPTLRSHLAERPTSSFCNKRLFLHR